MINLYRAHQGPNSITSSILGVICCHPQNNLSSASNMRQTLNIAFWTVIGQQQEYLSKKVSVVFKTSYKQVAISLIPSELAKVIPKYFSSNLTHRFAQKLAILLYRKCLVGKPHIILLQPREHLEISLLLVITFLRSCSIVNPQGNPQPFKVNYFSCKEEGCYRVA